MNVQYLDKHAVSSYGASVSETTPLVVALVVVCLQGLVWEDRLQFTLHCSEVNFRVSFSSAVFLLQLGIYRAAAHLEICMKRKKCYLLLTW